MTSAVRRLLACLLLVLLPLQAMATTLHAMEKQTDACAQMMMADTDCCEGDADTGAGCSPDGCLAVTVLPLLLPGLVVAPALPGAPCAASRAPPHYPTSFIPDGPQRPPQARS